MTEVLERAGAREADSAAERSRYAEEALDRAARAATSQWVTAAAFRGCTLAVDTDVQSYRRALHIVEHRDVVVRTAPGRGTRPGHLDALPDPSLIDPWGTGNENLEVATRVVVECTACAGAKHVACPACGGRARIRCDECEGKGEIRTTRNTNSVRVGQHLSARSSVSHGMKNCPRCHGDGQKKCPNCRNGFIDCGTCENTGRVTAWLEVTRSVSSQVVAHPENGATAVHVALRSGADFDASSWPNNLEEDRTLAPGDALPEDLRVTLNPRYDRTLRVRVQAFSSHVARVRYATLFGRGEVEVAGRPGAISPRSRWQPLQRAKILAAVAAIALVGSAGWLYFTDVREMTLGRVAAFAGGVLLALGLPLLLARTSAALRSNDGQPQFRRE